MILYNDRRLCRSLGNGGYSFALANCSRARLADQYLEILRTIVKGEEASSLPEQKDVLSDNINKLHEYAAESAEAEAGR
jgi:hypothetical protein